METLTYRDPQGRVSPQKLCETATGNGHHAGVGGVADRGAAAERYGNCRTETGQINLNDLARYGWPGVSGGDRDCGATTEVRCMSRGHLLAVRRKKAG